MPNYKSVEYSVRWKKDSGWEWEVYAKHGGAAGIIQGHVTSHRIEDFQSDTWRELAVNSAHAAIDLMLSQNLSPEL